MKSIQEFTDIRDKYYLPLFILICADFMVLSGSLLAAYFVRFHTVLFDWIPPTPPPDSTIPDLQPYFLLSITIGILGCAIFERFGLYERRVGLDRHVPPIIIIFAIVVSYIFLMALLFNYRGFSFSRFTVGLGIPISSICIVFAYHLLKRIQFFMIRNGYGFQKTAVIGPTWRCKEISQKLQDHYGSMFQILGYVTTDQNRREDKKPFLPCLGSIHQLAEIFQRGMLNNVIIALPPTNPDEIIKTIKLCTANQIPYRVVPEIFDLLSSRIQIDEFERLPTILFGESPLYGFGQIVKRFMDILVSGIALILTGPLMLIVAFLIKLDTKGPIFYVQERVGNDGQKFFIYKFRSMFADAENGTGPKWATSNDPRTTTIGRFLRRYNLDELPQFVNVLRGDMSVVGPRPERPYFVNKFKEEIPHYMRRHMVKSGITGWAQVNGLRGDTSVTERTKYDLYYVENWSLLFDFKILLKTLVSFKNAY